MFYILYFSSIIPFPSICKNFHNYSIQHFLILYYFLKWFHNTVYQSFMQKMATLYNSLSIYNKIAHIQLCIFSESKSNTVHPPQFFHSSVLSLLPKIRHRIKDLFQHIGQERREISSRNRFESFVFHHRRGLQPFIPNNYQPDFERRKSPRIVPSARAGSEGGNLRTWLEIPFHFENGRRFYC